MALPEDVADNVTDAVATQGAALSGLVWMRCSRIGPSAGANWLIRHHRPADRLDALRDDEPGRPELQLQEYGVRRNAFVRTRLAALAAQ